MMSKGIQRRRQKSLLVLLHRPQNLANHIARTRHHPVLTLRTRQDLHPHIALHHIHLDPPVPLGTNLEVVVVAVTTALSRRGGGILFIASKHTDTDTYNSYYYCCCRILQVKIGTLWYIIGSCKQMQFTGKLDIFQLPDGFWS